MAAAVGVLHVNLPSSRRLEVTVGCITPPEALDEQGSSRDLAVEMLLSLLLLHFQGKAGPENALQRYDVTNKMFPGCFICSGGIVTCH